ncbi:MAG: glycine/betaine/sarcosine/D-proline family reductase selenoprotein B [Chloroflexi bacterium]|nr:glycine/betaine/sarcosine/D-proline family reductase selenoprotein B [Chloroflexota bacterium]
MSGKIIKGEFTMAKVRLMHFLNQFFAGEGGEEKADLPLSTRHGPVGPGRRLQALLGNSAEIVVTAYCGDNHFPSHATETLGSILKIAQDNDVGMLVAGPSFGSGRYGLSCVEVCHAIAGSLRLRCVTGMHPENPGVDVYRQYKDKTVFAVPTTQDASGMEDALSKMAGLVQRLAAGSAMGSASAEGYLPRGYRLPGSKSRSGVERAVDMLLDKLAGRPFQTEIPVESAEPIPVPPRLRSLKDAHLALAGTAGIVPVGNPDGFKANRNTQWRKYSIDAMGSMLDIPWEVMHGGYNTQFMKENPNYGVPLDVCRELEAQGAFGKLYPFHYSTIGVLGLYAVMLAMGGEIVRDMKAEGIDAAILVST